MTAFDVHHVQQPGTPIERVVRPATIRQALRDLGAHANARLIAGGTDLLLDLQRGDAGPPVTLIDTSGIDEFRMIADEGDTLVAAGGVTHNQVVGDPRFRDGVLPLAQACVEIGSPQLRNRATLAGNLVTASPANDSISALLALGASVELSQLSSAGDVVSRTVPVAAFITGFRETDLREHELLSAVVIPKLRSNQRGIWMKLGLRKAQAISVVHGGIVLTFADDTTASPVVSARLVLGSVAPTVVVMPEFAAAIEGRELTDDSIAAAARATTAAVRPIDDGRATADYRRAAITPLISRALRSIRAGTETTMWLDNPPLLASMHEGYKRPPRPDITDSSPVRIGINGTPYTGGAAATLTLLDWIRGRGTLDSKLTGTKEGCAEGECGACTVQLNGSAVMSCLVSAAQADGADLVTVEGLAGRGDALLDLQQAFIDEFAAQCGFCIPGFLVAADRLLAENPAPTDDQIALALSGNLCRCTGYYPIIAAVKAAAAERAGARLDEPSP